MKNTNKKMFAVMTITMLIMGISTIAFGAAWDSFNVSLPKNNGDIEVSTVKRANGKTTKKCFEIKLSSIGSGYTAVCAWTEKPNGTNYSNPGNQVNTISQTIKYSTVPEKGKNVVLNLDNPVKTTNTPKIKGEWTPY